MSGPARIVGVGSSGEDIRLLVDDPPFGWRIWSSGGDQCGYVAYGELESFIDRLRTATVIDGTVYVQTGPLTLVRLSLCDRDAIVQGAPLLYVLDSQRAEERRQREPA